MMQFHVSQVADTLGLTLFVAGYGLGPMVWAPLSEIPQIGEIQYTSARSSYLYSSNSPSSMPKTLVCFSLSGS
jgi:hypothetical protein